MVLFYFIMMVIILIVYANNSKKKNDRNRINNNHLNRQNTGGNNNFDYRNFPNGNVQSGNGYGSGYTNHQQQQIHTVNGDKMSQSEMDNLKQAIMQRNNFNQRPQQMQQPQAQQVQQKPYMGTLDHEEFHSERMVAGSTGTYSDMQGGTKFANYDCGHEYNDEIVHTEKKEKASQFRTLLQDKNNIKNAVIVSEILKRRV
ncbi:MAG: hypothetical protein Q4F06_04665 [Eubacteriales bacterium]|nr:hypothetical protein [Eubacteriales bacterium]